MDITGIPYNSTTAEFSAKVDDYFNDQWNNNQNLFFAERLIYTDATKATAAATDAEANVVMFKITMRYPVGTARET